MTSESKKEQQVSGAVRKRVTEKSEPDFECPFEENRKMRKTTLERANRVAEKVRSISFAKK